MPANVNPDRDNFLHANPPLYLTFNGEEDSGMARFIHKLLREFGSGPKVLDVGCGPGREVAWLSEAGYDVTGLDQSEEMLRWARERYPRLPFIRGDQESFELREKFDALTCVGSTFLYNFTNENVHASLACFRSHLNEGGLLYLDMRNAAFFLTREGQRWLQEELVDQRVYEGQAVTLRTRFSIDLPRQLLLRDYSWEFNGQEPIAEHLQHRLLFPQELVRYLNEAGFRVLELFDHPAPHIGAFEEDQPLAFGTSMQGRRLQLLAQAI
ncbi:class I SAM-dependent methyltransferase [Saccharibacillus deserti]|uniref:class I SAM-dependent methyltransferase n=1 Tax=Saccharibacillus deserti TaxID=1634444 RepID=UPI0015568A0C|nr:class I SAM-dependent methyltransferase [Saccharibacillus deserti]